MFNQRHAAGEDVSKRQEENKIVIVRFYVRQLAYIVVPMPLLAMLACILLSVINNFEQSTFTHCQVPNVLPSISAAISYTPQRYIWRIAIALHTSPRLLVAWIYHNHYLKVGPSPSIAPAYKYCVKIAVSLHVIENLALVVLSYVSSNENYPIHEKSFITFIVTSQVYMLLTCALQKWSRHTMTILEKRSHRLKIRFAILNIGSMLTATYVFYRHNKYCEPYAYSVFCVLEYAVVLSNVAFHSTAACDFPRYILLAAETGHVKPD